MPDKIQAEYATLEKAVAQFTLKADEVGQLKSTVARCTQALQGGGWIGQGANQFFKEMQDLVMPGMNRLASALKDASSATRRIHDTMRNAEIEAARLFQGGDLPKPGRVPPPSGRVDVVGGNLAADAFDDRRLPYTIGSPTEVANYPFTSGNATALKYEVEINGRKIEVYYPKTLDKRKGKVHSMEEVAKGLAALPEASRKLVTKVQVNPGPNPDDAYWKKKYKNFSASYMTAGADGVIDIYPSRPKMSQSYLDGTMIHETGHTLSMQQWGNDYSSEGWTKWKAAIDADKRQVSKYGNNSLGEDFSEALQQYMTYKGTKYEADAAKLWPNRFKIIEEMVK